MPTILTQDNYSRTVSSGWGTASDGVSTWAGSASPLVSVGGNEGQFITTSPSAFPYQYINNKTASNLEIVFRTSLGASGNLVYAMVRMQSASPNNCYTALLYSSKFQLQKVVSGVGSTLASVFATPTPSSFYWIRLRVAGPIIYGKYWQDGTTEPSSWTLQATDTTFTSAGNYGIGSTLGTTVAIQVDTLTVYQVFSLATLANAHFLILQQQKQQFNARFLLDYQLPQTGLPLTIAQDTFTRANRSGWGTASDTESWTVITGNPANYNIVSNKGTITTTVATYYALLGTGAINNGDFRVRFTPSASNDYQGFVFGYLNSSNYCYTEIAQGDVSIYKVVNGTGTQLSPTGTTTIVGNTSYWQHLSVNGTTATLRVWADGTSEPSTWNITITNTVFQNIGQYGLHAFLNNTADTIRFDSFSVATSPSVYYVATTGNDANPGTQSQPFLTMQKAANSVKASDTVYCSQGTFTQQPGTSLTTNASGTPTAGIAYLTLNVPYGASIRTTGNSTVWTNNGSYTTIQGFDLSSSDTTTRLGINNTASRCLIQSCRIHDIGAIGSGTAGGAGIDMSNYASSNNDAIDNLIHDIGYASGTNSVHCIYYSCAGGKIQNNVVYRAGAFGIHLWHGANSIFVSNNLSFANLFGGIVIGGVLGEGVGVDDYTTVINNIVVYNVGTSGGIRELGSTGSHNQYLNNILWQNANVGGGSSQIVLQNGLIDSGTLYVDPLLVNYQSDGSGDYHLQSSSPAIGGGISAITPLNDFHGFLRLFRTDIGAYQYIPFALFPNTSRRTGLFPTLKRRQS